MTDDELAAVADATAQTIPGVARLFAAESSPVRAARQVTAGRDAVLPLSTVGAVDGGRRITVSVEVDGSRPSAEVAADVASAVRALDPTAGTRVSVRVGRVAAERSLRSAAPAEEEPPTR